MWYQWGPMAAKRNKSYIDRLDRTAAAWNLASL